MSDKLPQLCSAQDFDERWLEPGAIVPVIPPNMGAVLREVLRLRHCLADEQRGREKDGAIAMSAIRGLKERLAARDAYAGLSNAVIAPARELLFLYDWRFELAEQESRAKQEPERWSPQAAAELKRKLREYGERKKAGWIALRVALDAVDKSANLQGNPVDKSPEMQGSGVSPLGVGNAVQSADPAIEWWIRDREDELAVIDLIEEVRALRRGVSVSYPSAKDDPIRRLVLLSQPEARSNVLRSIENARASAVPSQGNPA